MKLISFLNLLRPRAMGVVVALSLSKTIFKTKMPYLLIFTMSLQSLIFISSD